MTLEAALFTLLAGCCAVLIVGGIVGGYHLIRDRLVLEWRSDDWKGEGTPRW